MKKYSINSTIKTLIVLLVTFTYQGLQGQMIVSTKPQNKKALVEEFGGLYCGYCVDGYEILDQIEATYMDQVAFINIHTGYFAIPDAGHPDLRTEWGYALDISSGNGQAYPAATVNRQVFPGWELFDNGTTAIGRSKWTTAVANVVTQDAPVNIAVQANFHPSSNNLTIYVEVFYTDNTQQDTNFLNVAILQNNIVAPQLTDSGWLNTEYIHKHVLRDLVTGQWGEPLIPTSDGYFESRTYTYQLPAQYRGVPVNIEDLEIVAFITEDHHEVLNVAKTDIIINGQNHTLDANAWEAGIVSEVCDGELQPTLFIRNDGTENLNSLHISYQVNGGESYEYDWSGYLSQYQSACIWLPPVSFQASGYWMNELSVQISDPNEGTDENPMNDQDDHEFEDPPIAPTNLVVLTLKTDDFGHETYWEFIGPTGEILMSGGNQNVGANGGGEQTATPSDPGAYPSNTLITEYLELPTLGCYQFRIVDDYADGICCTYGQGYYRIKDEFGSLLGTGGAFGQEENKAFLRVESVTSNSEEPETQLRLFPNPATETANIELSTNVGTDYIIIIYNTLGQQLWSGHGINSSNYQLDVSGLVPGCYWIDIQIGEERLVKKLIVEH